MVLFLVVSLQLSEHPGGGLKSSGSKLVTHDQDVMLGEGFIERGAGFCIDWPGEIDSVTRRRCDRSAA